VDPVNSSSLSGQLTDAYAPEASRTVTPRQAIALVAGDGSSTTLEIAGLLRRRLRILGVIASCSLVLLAAFVLPESLGNAWWQLWAILGAGLLVSVTTTILVWSRLPLSLRMLRTLEISAVVVSAGLVTWYTLDCNLRLRHTVAMMVLGSGPQELARPVPGDPTRVETWRVDLGDYSMHFLIGHFNFFWFAIIFSYALFIPNPLWRSALVVSCVVALAILVWVFIVWYDGALRGILLYSYYWGVTSSLLFAAALAIFGSYRLESLRRQAAQARRLGQYQLKQKLGAGGMGEVYLAEHLLLRRPCAIKLIRPERAGDPRNLTRFEREVQATATLTNWHTVEIFDYGRSTDGTFYYVMEYLPGWNLEQLVAREGPLPARRVVHLLRQVAEALREAHGIGLIHRDIKPSNIITGRRGGRDDVAKLLDFGLVLAPSAESNRERLTQDDMVAGTPSYMSPEQAGGSDGLDARSDLYSLGAVAYFLLTGQPPFTGKNALQVLAAHRNKPVPPLRDHCPDLPANVEAVVLRCLEKDPARRCADADQLLHALERCQDDFRPLATAAAP
jgi:Protein kinase domain